MPSTLSVVIDTFARSGLDLSRWGLAWARAAPSVALVPAFGLRALPAPARVVLGLAFGAVVFPAMPPVDLPATRFWGLQIMAEGLRGLPVAIATAVPLWAATMAGGITDALRASQESAQSPTVEGRATPLGVPMSLMACAIFLRTGGPARVAEALAAQGMAADPVFAAVHDLVRGIGLAVALAGPLLAGSVVVEVAAALIARSAAPAQVHALLAPIRAIAVLAVLGFAFERLESLLAAAVLSVP